jgi:hypothetical protein
MITGRECRDGMGGCQFSWGATTRQTPPESSLQTLKDELVFAWAVGDGGGGAFVNHAVNDRTPNATEPSENPATA